MSQRLVLASGSAVAGLVADARLLLVASRDGRAHVVLGGDCRGAVRGAGRRRDRLRRRQPRLPEDPRYDGLGRRPPRHNADGGAPRDSARAGRSRRVPCRREGTRRPPPPPFPVHRCFSPLDRPKPASPLLHTRTRTPTAPPQVLPHPPPPCTPCTPCAERAPPPVRTRTVPPAGGTFHAGAATAALLPSVENAIVSEEAEFVSVETMSHPMHGLPILAPRDGSARDRRYRLDRRGHRHLAARRRRLLRRCAAVPSITSTRRPAAQTHQNTLDPPPTTPSPRPIHQNLPKSLHLLSCAVSPAGVLRVQRDRAASSSCTARGSRRASDCARWSPTAEVLAAADGGATLLFIACTPQTVAVIGATDPPTAASLAWLASVGA